MKYSVISSAEGNAQEKYPSLFKPGLLTLQFGTLEAQSLLGVEGFAEGLRHVVTGKQQIREIPKGQRFMGRRSLEKLFSTRSPGNVARDRLIAEAVYSPQL